MATSENGRLEESMANLAQARTALVQARAVLVQNQAALVAQVRQKEAESREIQRENRERFARIEALLLEHNRMLEALPEAVRQKIGFAGQWPRGRNRPVFVGSPIIIPNVTTQP